MVQVCAVGQRRREAPERTVGRSVPDVGGIGGYWREGVCEWVVVAVVLERGGAGEESAAEMGGDGGTGWSPCTEAVDTMQG